MSGGSPEVHRDNDYIATGTHQGGTNDASLNDPGADFKSCGINGNVGQAIYNDTQSTNGNVTASTEDTVTDDTNVWTDGDTYYIYATSEYNSVISTQWIDRSRGWKADKKELDRGWRSEDVDLDRDEPHVWSPGFPEKS